MLLKGNPIDVTPDSLCSRKRIHNYHLPQGDASNKMGAAECQGLQDRERRVSPGEAAFLQ